MASILEELEQKKQQLKEIKDLHMSAGCSSSHTSGADMRREMEIEDLEDEIKELEQKAAAGV